jgi:AraC-like DNA-binding protein
VRQYDEFDGLSQRLVKQVVQTDDGLIWLATWNGLNRFDGYTFAKVRPAADDPARRYSERFGDIRVSASGDLWCKVDERLLFFDVRRYRFTDVTPTLEQVLGRKVSVRNLYPVLGAQTVVECVDSGYILLHDTLPDFRPQYFATRPEVRYRSVGNRQAQVVNDCPYDGLIYARQDTTGGRWAITAQGAVYYSARPGEAWEQVRQIEAPRGTLFYCTTDHSGHVWLRSTVGAFRLTMGTCPYRTLTPELPSRVRQIHRDATGRLWLSESDAEVVVCYEATDTLLQHPRYLTPDGVLAERCTPFGHQAYSFTSAPDGTLWIGTKPDGLFRLTPRDGGGAQPTTQYTLLHLQHDEADPQTLSNDNIYDLRYDRRGRLWLATLGGGIDCLPRPDAPQPAVVRLMASADYPAEALRVRRLQIVGDTLLMAATTGGLLVAELPAEVRPDRFRPRLHVSEPERATSLGNVALMDVLTDYSGRTFVATESDGVNCLTHRPTPADTLWQFRRLDEGSGQMSDVALALSLDAEEEVLRVVSNNRAYEVTLATGEVHDYGPSFWHRQVRFCDTPPVRLPDGRWIYGVEDGAVIVAPASHQPLRTPLPLCFTAVSIENRPDSLLASTCDTLLLSSTERNLLLHFALPDAEGEVHYASRLDGGAWASLGTAPTITLLNLRPGLHRLEVRTADGEDSARTLWIEVTPTVWETPWARALYVLLSLAALLGGVYLWLYIRAIKRKQSETMAAYLRLLNAPRPAEAPCSEETSAPVSDTKDQEAAPRSAADEAFMHQVADFIHQHLGNSEVNIDDLASATATSRSGLNRKMKHLFGMSPAEFIRESRISRAATLLRTTDRSISDIAWECGFSDLNYFSKCFKAKHKITPSAYRKQGESA